MVTNDEFEMGILFLCVQEELPLFQKAVTRKQAGSVKLCGLEATKSGGGKPRCRSPWLRRLNFI